jgi:beta-N-acetylhexosaminidase
MDAQRGIARRMVIGLPREGLSPQWEKDFAAYAPAGLILFRRDFRDLDDLRRLTRRLRELARPRRIFIAIDEEGGFVSQLGGLLDVPPAAGLLGRGAQAGDIEYVSRVTGERLRALGIDWVYAPVADIHSEPRNPVIGPRAYGTTAADVSRRVGEALAGFRSAGVASCLKHFPGHGDTLVDSHLALPRSEADAATLEARELAPFRAHAGADAVMSAHLVAPALDPAQPATFSRAIIRGVLRERLGFTGVCITDALEMKGAAEGRGPAESGRLALEAGCDLLLYAFHDEEVRRARGTLAKQLVDGVIDRENFDAARPRLAAFDDRTREPTEEELSRPLETLTPAGWVERLEAIVDRGLGVQGALPAAAGAWSVREPAPAYGPPLRAELEAQGVASTDGDGGRVHVEVIASRVPLPPAERERLRARTQAGPTVVVALQADEFLADLDGAAVRVSACDATPLTRRVVARRLAGLARGV